MDRLEEKRANRINRRAQTANRVRWVLLLGIVVFALGFLGVKFYRQSALNAKLDEQIASLEEQIAQQEAQKEHYDNLTELYKTEEYQKLFAKERLGLVEENEKIFIDVSGQ